MEGDFAPDVIHWESSESRQAVPSENLCHPRHHKRGNRVSGGVERSETVLEGTACGEGQVGGFLMCKMRREKCLGVCFHTRCDR